MMRNILAALYLLISVLPAQAGDRVWISEFATMRAEAQAPFPNLPSVTNYAIDITGGPKTSTAFKPGTRFIRVVCEVQCTLTAKPATATASDILLPALMPHFFGVQPGGQISVVATP
jgi:hypothetical protein